ncbi:alpha/beta hydrolase [Sphingomonas naphthae]|uniref:Alpha/beta hydrolase n=1 Tax=Sphingomonas naphthae TaxID=1813468 RepID=A0ABY7TGD9_9SPHN|nr:alpha/beta hydrolase [Sphingomonas naphthae]WCT72036.1 alpha/beta hydrolase [Sphingomonas naphthae]
MRFDGMVLALIGMLTAIPAHAAPTTIGYGADPKQTLEFHPAPAGKPKPPLVIFIHGGGWRRGDLATGTGAKPDFFTARGYAFATINYRLVPQVTVADEARDVAAAVARLRRDAARLGFDPDRIALIGHSAGAHLAALVGTEPAYLKAAGVPISAIRAVSLLDGAAYDVPRQMETGRPILRRLYGKAFGDDEATQAALSPTRHAAAPNAGAFLIHCLSQRSDSCPQAEALATALGKAGTAAKVVPVDGTTHRQLNQNIGADGDGPSAEVAAFLAGAFR